MPLVEFQSHYMKMQDILWRGLKDLCKYIARVDWFPKHFQKTNSPRIFSQIKQGSFQGFCKWNSWGLWGRYFHKLNIRTGSFTKLVWVPIKQYIKSLSLAQCWQPWDQAQCRHEFFQNNLKILIKNLNENAIFII